MVKNKNQRNKVRKQSDSSNSTFSKQRVHFSLSEAKHRLRGSRFRTLNEKLYTSTSNENLIYYKHNPNLFDIYHEGYREQVAKWPLNPLTDIISWLNQIDDIKIIGDFGCGEALIAQTFTNRTVYSFDLIAGNPFITACNIAKVPLDDNSLDICIFCLSLMGKDWPLFILEATRCLKKGGILKIVEVSSRFKDIQQFKEFITSLGYINEDHNTLKETKFFTSFQFTLNNKGAQTYIPPNTNELLLPCPYKRR